MEGEVWAKLEFIREVDHKNAIHVFSFPQVTRSCDVMTGRNRDGD